MAAAVLDLHPDGDHPVVAGVFELHRLLGRMHAGTDVPLTAGGHATLVAELDRAAHRITALKLKIVAAADQAGTPADAGFAGTEAWVASTTTSTRNDAAREVRLARELRSGTHDAAAAALDGGSISPGHAQVILNAERALPEGVSNAQLHQVEEALVQKAQRYNPDQLRGAARRAIEAIEPDQDVVDAHENEQVRTEEEAARDQSRLTLRDNGDGTTTGHFTVPTTTAAFLRKILEAMTSPRRMREGSANTGGTPGDRHYDWDHRRGLALAELLEHLPTDHLHDKTAATLVVTLSHHVLQGALKAAHLDTGSPLSAGQARRLACGAGLIPAVLGTGSVTLDLGRETRLFTQPQRIATGLRHDTCAASGCDRPYAWCELHHRQPWAHGGRTDLQNAVPLCHWHHQRIHDPDFDHRHLPDDSVRLSRRP